jgi:tyrosyl-tRNA synthetase
MLAKDSVQGRLNDREHGISYTEFSYMILQAYDFYVLNKEKACNLQLGGSDQWGNITAGVELIRRKNASLKTETQPVFGLTWPLVTKTDGTKFGKTESGTVWLSADKTSPYEFYQFFLRTPDQDVIKYLKYFTFLSLEEIARLENSVKTAPEKREAQMALAQELTMLVHGEEELKKAQGSSSSFFNANLSELDPQALANVVANAPSTEKPIKDLETGISIVDLLVETKLVTSKGQARQDIQGGGIYLNNQRVSDLALKLGLNDLVHGKYILLRKGKKNYHSVVFL